VSDALYQAVAAYALAERLPLAAHIAESAAEDDLVARGEGVFADGLRKRGIAIEPRAASSILLLDRLGVLATNPLLIQCVRLAAREFDCLIGKRFSIAHCPVSNAKLGHGTAPLHDMLGAGFVVGLGSDSVASNNRMDLLAEARAAVLAQRARVSRHDVLCARDVLHLATLGGARALGLEGEIGSLDAGKSADLAAFPLEACALPVHDPEAAAVFALPGVAASLVTVAGRELVREGRLRDVDRALPTRIDDTARLMREWLATAG
jgi:cytosine/adenosine deaminase-related metal-dependent hydrolase